MNWQITGYLLPYIISLIISLGVAIYSWQHRSVNSAAEYAFVAFVQALWTFGFILELISPEITEKIFLDNAQWISTLALPMAFLAFALKYSGHKLTSPKLFWGLLSIIPVISLILVFTSNYHSLIRVNSHLISGNPFSELTYDFTISVKIIAMFCLLLSVSSIAILVRKYIHLHRLYRIQTGIIVLGAVIPIAGTLLTLFDLAPTFHRDMTPITAAIGNIFVIWGLFRFQLFDIVPVARDLVFKSLNDIIVVLDSQNRVIDINDAGLAVLDKPAFEIIGKPANQVFVKWSYLLVKYQHVLDTHTELKIKTKQDFRHFDFNLSPIRNHNQEIVGRLAVLRDITKRVQIDKELKEHRDHLENIVEERTADLMTSNKKLRKEIEKRKKMEIKIQNELKTKDSLLKEIHHRVKNNLQIISSLHSLQSQTIEDPQLVQIFYDCQNRVKSMALIHEHLYQVKDFNKIDFKIYVRNLIYYLYKTYNIRSNKIKLTLNIEIKYINLDLGIPCGLIINELVSNILKYAFPPSFNDIPKIAISFRKKDTDKNELIVRDNGIGLPQDFDIQEVQSLGMRLVHILVEHQLNGEIKIDRMKGAKFTILF